MLRRLSSFILVLVSAAVICGCSSDESSVTKDQEKAWRNPPKGQAPPPQYGGPAVGAPGAPPANAKPPGG